MKKTTKDTLVMALMVFILVGSGFISAGAAILKQDVYLDASSINGVDISGLSPEQAEQKVLESERMKREPVELSVECEGQAMLFTAENTGQTSMAEQQIHEYLHNIEEGSATEKYDTLLAFRKDVIVDYKYEYDMNKIKAELVQFAAQFEQPAMDAMLEIDFDGMGFVYTEEHEGKYLDVDEAAALVYEKLKQGGNSRLELQLKTSQPEVTQQQLQEETKQIGSCTANIENGRYEHNIDLICEALNGSVIISGGVLSLNALTGERGPHNGYTESLGSYDDNSDEYGEGVDQLAGALYYAALTADMEIVERNRHSAPVGYLDAGLDALIDIATNRDLIIKNVSEKPAYIFAKREGNEVTVEIYGKLLRPEYQIRIETEVVEWIPPGEPQYIYDAELGIDQKELEQHEHEGANVIVWRRYYGDDPENPVDSKRISTDNYEPRKAIYRTGDQSLTTK